MPRICSAAVTARQPASAQKVHANRSEEGNDIFFAGAKKLQCEQQQQSGDQRRASAGRVQLNDRPWWAMEHAHDA